MIGKIFRAFSNDWKNFSEGNLDNSSAGGRREGRGREFSHKGGGKESGREAGGGNLQEYLEYRCADLGGLEGEGIYIEKRENRFADMEKWKQKRQIGRDKEAKQKCPTDFFGRFSPLLESRREETTWTTWDNFFKVAGRTTPPGGKKRIGICLVFQRPRRRRTASPSAPNPSNAIVPGSGTAGPAMRNVALRLSSRSGVPVSSPQMIPVSK